MHPETVNRLRREGTFPLEQAVALAEAIDMALEREQLVTVPILDARLAVLEARLDSRIQALDAKFDRKFDRFRLQMIVAMILTSAATGPLGAAAMTFIRHSL